ncbi:Ig-like domain-containing protein [Labilibacter marinus]|uniref:Ig-like domain-containing protein n=1 Tax=Labilibacter marinus TaxID=1477105 RepID=UPI00082C0718|nr:Ig-like domain-containing protein [Labilibacter marinus]
MKKKSTLLFTLLLGLFIIFFADITASGIEYGDNFIVFEAEAASFSSSHWKLRTPSYADYERYVSSGSQSGIAPVNDTYLQYTGPWQGDGENSKIEYKFTCPSTGDYQLAMRLHQPLEAGEKGDAKNDFFVKMAGDFTSASKFATDDLTHKHKFWGRGINQWGTAQYLEHGGSDIPVYRLTEGKEYTFTMYGRSTGACVDYILFFKTALKLGVTNKDLAQQNPELYRPNGPATLLNNVAKIMFDKSSTYLSQVGETKSIAYKIFPTTATDKSITWTSSDEDVVTVDENGMMTAIAIGQASITATTTDGNITATNQMEVGKYIETFEDYISYNLTANKFMGDNGIEWTMRAQNTIRMNTTNAIQFNKNMTGIKAEKITGGIGSFSIQCKHLYLDDSARTLELLINGNVVGTKTFTGTGNYNFTVEDINVEGNFSLLVKNATVAETKSYTVMFDNLTWTPYGDQSIGVDDAIVATFAEMGVSISPNPSSTGVIRVSGLNAGNYAAHVYSMSGALVHNNMFDVLGSDTAVFNIKNLSKGVYLIVLKSNDAVLKSKFVVN